MMTRRTASTDLVSSAILSATPGFGAQEATMRELPQPRPGGGKPLIEALKRRQSTREYSEQALPAQVILSDLLWAAFGINRA